MQSLEVSGAVRPIYGSLGVKRLNFNGLLTASVQCSQAQRSLYYNVTLRKLGSANKSLSLNVPEVECYKDIP